MFFTQTYFGLAEERNHHSFILFLLSITGLEPQESEIFSDAVAEKALFWNSSILQAKLLHSGLAWIFVAASVLDIDRTSADRRCLLP